MEYILLIGMILQMSMLCSSKVFVSFKFNSYQNQNGEDWNGEECDYFSKCDHFFIFCIDQSDGVEDNVDTCRYTRKVSGVFEDQDSIVFGADIRGVQNPIVVEVPNAATGVLLKVEVWDKDSSPKDLVDKFNYRHTFDENLAKDKVSAPQIAATLVGNKGTRFTITRTSYCAPHYYKGSGTCDQHCEARDDQHGHYRCDDQGRPMCLTGWSDTSSSCMVRDTITPQATDQHSQFTMSTALTSTVSTLSAKTTSTTGSSSSSRKITDPQESNASYASTASTVATGKTTMGCFIGLLIGTSTLFGFMYWH